MSIRLPEAVAYIIDTLSARQYEAYAVGGCIRDSLLRLPPKDWDIATSARPAEIKACFTHTVDTGIQHGTVTVLINRIPYEVTTFRIDGTYLDSRRPSSVTYTPHIRDDLSRRDFTMNAIAYHPDAGLIDPFGGAAAIQQRLIRCVGNPQARFSEDALRMLRAVRFAAQLGFTIDEATQNAIIPLAYRLAHISSERVRDELTKLLHGAYPQALTLLEATGLWPFVLRGHPFSGHLATAAERISRCAPVTAMRYTLLLADTGMEQNDHFVRQFMRDLRFDNHTVSETALYAQWLYADFPAERYAVKKILSGMSLDYFENCLALQKILAATSDEQKRLDEVQAIGRDIVQCGECYTLRQLAVNGRDLAAAGVPDGKATGAMLAYLLDRVMREPTLNQKEILLNAVSARL